MKSFAPKKENLLNILHAVQNGHPNNFLSEESLTDVAEYLNLPKSTVMGVATYYSMYSTKPRGKNIIRLCVSPVCDMMKSGEILDYLRAGLGVEVGEATPCCLFTLETSECLGHCASAPCMMINQDVYDSLSTEKVSKIISQLQQTENL